MNESKPNIKLICSEVDHFFCHFAILACLGPFVADMKPFQPCSIIGETFEFVGLKRVVKFYFVHARANCRNLDFFRGTFV